MKYSTIITTLALGTLAPTATSAESKPEALQKLEELINIAQRELPTTNQIRSVGEIYIDPYCGKGYTRVTHVGLARSQSEIDWIGKDGTEHLTGSYYVYHVSVEGRGAKGKPLEYTVDVKAYPTALSANTQQFNPTLNQRDPQYGIQLKMKSDQLTVGMYSDKPLEGEDTLKLSEEQQAALKSIFNQAIEKAKPTLAKCTPREYEEWEYPEGWDDQEFIILKFSKDGKLIND